mmetsp:Transcript_7825/g.5870  ORF Transcript_7825/g.5870 Transcript_7825/m.5870 type:complete len:96 (+) Transcript_7825:429-716(+)
MQVHILGTPIHVVPAVPSEPLTASVSLSFLPFAATTLSSGRWALYSGIGFAALQDSSAPLGFAASRLTLALAVVYDPSDDAHRTRELLRHDAVEG